jgi:hypothetical protein
MAMIVYLGSPVVCGWLMEEEAKSKIADLYSVQEGIVKPLESCTKRAWRALVSYWMIRDYTGDVPGTGRKQALLERISPHQNQAASSSSLRASSILA